MTDFSQRLKESESLDNLKLNGQDLHRTLNELKKINRLLLNTYVIKRAVYKLIKNHRQKEFLILDLGSGGGDILIDLANDLKKKGIKASFIGIDGNPNSVAYANKKAQDLENVSFREADLFDKNFVLPGCDIVISSHFMYHFEEKVMINFIKEHLEQVRIGFLISELERSRLAYALFKYLGFFIGLGEMARKDGLTAIRRAYTFDELGTILHQFPENNVRHFRPILFRQIAIIK